MKAVLFSDWIKEQMKQKPGWSGGTLAERAKISRAAAYFYINGSRVPNEITLGRIAIALGMERSTMPAFTPRRES